MAKSTRAPAGPARHPRLPVRGGAHRLEDLEAEALAVTKPAAMGKTTATTSLAVETSPAAPSTEDEE